MRKIFNQITYNLKKEKSSFISFGVIMMIAALILNCSSVLMMQVDTAYNEKSEKLNTATINVIVSDIQSDSGLEEYLGKITGVEKIEGHKAILAEATVKDFNGADFTMNTMFYNMDDNRSLNNYELVGEIEKDVENPVCIPLYISRFGGFATGDKISYSIDGKIHVFTVAGVIEEMQYGNYGSSIIGAYFPQKEYNKLSDSYDSKAVVEYSMTLSDNSDIQKVKKDISKILEDKGVMMLMLLDSASVKSTRTMVTDLLILILAAFSLIILVVSVFLSNFRVKNSIESEIVNMSVLKALGYTSSQIVAGISLPYAIVSTVFSMIGAGVSYALLPILSAVLTVQSGFSFSISFDLLSFSCVTILLTGVVAFFTYLSARKIKKTQPIDGLRGNSGSKASHKNYFPLAETKGNTKFILVVKQIFACKKQNVMLFLVIFVLTILVAFSGTLFFNVAVKPENFMSALSDETPDVIIIPQADTSEDLQNRLKNDNRIKIALKYISDSVKIEDKAVTVSACEDFTKVRNDACYMGRNPEKADEIALGSAFENKFRIGDMVKVTLNDISETFKVTGFVQSVNLKGEFCQLSLNGYEKLLNCKQTPSLYVYLNNSSDAEKVTMEYKNEYPNLVADSVNSFRLQQEARKMYMGITVSLVMVIFVVTILIVLFIMYIVIRSLLVKRRQKLGVYKAMGYTSSQLIFQTAGSFIPVFITATLLSGFAALFYMPAVYDFIFESLGVMKNNIEISLGFLMLFAAVQIMVNFIISIILCMPIRKISAYSLIKE